MKNKFIIAALLIVALFVVSYFYSKYRVAPVMDFQTLELTDLNNKPVKLADFKGKKVFVNFFATWCGPCVKEMPSLQDAQATLQNEGFAFVCISDEPVEHLLQFVERTHVQLIILHSTQKMHEHNVYTIPTSYVLNTAGKVVFGKVGERDWNDKISISQLRKATE